MRTAAIAALCLVALIYASPLLLGQQAAVVRTAAAQTGPPVTDVPGTVLTPAPGTPTTPAVTVTTVSSPAAPQNLVDSAIWALLMSYALRFVTKWSKFSPLSAETPARIKAFVGFVVAASTAAGIHIVVNGSFFTHDGLAFSATGLSFDAFKDIAFQWAFQQGWYDALVKRSA